MPVYPPPPSGNPSAPVSFEHWVWHHTERSPNLQEPCEPDKRAREREIKADIAKYHEYQERIREHQEFALERYGVALIALKGVIEAQQAILAEHQRYRNCLES